MQYYNPTSLRSVARQPYRREPLPNKKNQKGFARIALMLSLVGILVWAGSSIASIGQVHADANQPEILSGEYGYCLNLANGTKLGSAVNTSKCNGSVAQYWQITGAKVKNRGKYCLSLDNSKAEIASCNSPTSSWSVHGVGLLNDATHQCLSMPNGRTGMQLTVSSCGDLTSLYLVWTPSYWTGLPISQMSSPACNQKQLGLRVACFAKRQWLAWQTEPKIHEALLNDYTDANPYEEWCADFVSYVYWEAGAPFTSGERNGWDQYNANDIRYMGFSYHSASSSYMPKPGDVAFFDYSGGHVEIVVSGGRHPTFVYGDSGVKDPVTGNGNMAENQITADGSAGHLVYYLSPNN